MNDWVCLGMKVIKTVGDLLELIEHKSAVQVRRGRVVRAYHVELLDPRSIGILSEPCSHRASVEGIDEPRLMCVEVEGENWHDVWMISSEPLDHFAT